jgi:hypothetical protein
MKIRMPAISEASGVMGKPFMATSPWMNYRGSILLHQ